VCVRVRVCEFVCMFACVCRRDREKERAHTKVHIILAILDGGLRHFL